MTPLIGGLLDAGLKIIDKVIPDPAAKAQAQAELLKLQQQGALKEMEVSLSAIIAEANSSDPWTSRARPSFLYVVYVLLLWSIPMGVLAMFNPVGAAAFTSGFKGWLAALPEPVLTLFGVVMTGYVAGRSWEKTRGKA